MIATLNGSPVKRTDGDRTICERKGPTSSRVFVYIAMSAVPISNVLMQVRTNKATFIQGNFCSGACSNTISADGWNELSMQQLTLFLKRLQILAGFETHGFSG